MKTPKTSRARSASGQQQPHHGDLEPGGRRHEDRRDAGKCADLGTAAEEMDVDASEHPAGDGSGQQPGEHEVGFSGGCNVGEMRVAR